MLVFISVLFAPFPYRYFSETSYWYRYFQNCPMNIFRNWNNGIFQKCQFIDNWYFIWFNRTWLLPTAVSIILSFLMRGLWAPVVLLTFFFGSGGNKLKCISQNVFFKMYFSKFCCWLCSSARTGNTDVLPCSKFSRPGL